MCGVGEEWFCCIFFGYVVEIYYGDGGIDFVYDGEVMGDDYDG